MRLSFLLEGKVRGRACAKDVRDLRAAGAPHEEILEDYRLPESGDITASSSQ